VYQSAVQLTRPRVPESPDTGADMAKNMIYKKDGTPTPFFWSDKDGKALTEKTVFKKTDTGITRMKGVHFDVGKNAIRKD
jgi:hypothetical protein